MPALTDDQRYPLLTEPARRYLSDLLQHPSAPRWTHRCGDRLDAAGLQRVRDFERELGSSPPAWRPNEPPAWVKPFAERCLDTVPLHRERGGAAGEFTRIPSTTRADLARRPWALVPDAAALDDLIVYDTSGRTGHPIVVPCHPEVSSMYLPLLRAALATRGVSLEGGPDRVSIVNVCVQRSTFTFASLSSYLGWAGFAKVNLAPGDWRDPGDRVRFLEACDPEIYTGDPLAFVRLAALPLTTRPRGLVSTSMTLSPRLAADLEQRFGCPVLDLYSMTESGPVAVAVSAGRHRVLPHDLYVEVLDAEDRPCPPGTRGEVTLTGGRNPFLPLLRYRTGDWASLEVHDGVVHLGDLQGRAPAVFRDVDGQVFNNVDVSAALRPLGLPLCQLHQAADGRVRFRMVEGSATQTEVRAVLAALFGETCPIEVGALEDEGDPGRTLQQYTSDLDVESASEAP